MEKNTDRIFWSAVIVGLGLLLSTIFLGIKIINPDDGSSLLKLGAVQRICNASFDTIHDHQGTLSENLLTVSSYKDLWQWSDDKVPVSFQSDTEATLRSKHGGFSILRDKVDFSKVKVGDIVKLSVQAKGTGKLQLNYGDYDQGARLDQSTFYDGYGSEFKMTSQYQTYRRYYQIKSLKGNDFIVFSSGNNANVQVKDVQIQVSR